MSTKKGFDERGAARVVVTTTISHALWSYLKENNVRLARWIDEQENRGGGESAAALHERIDRLVGRLNEQCRRRQEVERRVKEIEDGDARENGKKKV